MQPIDDVPNATKDLEIGEESLIYKKVSTPTIIQIEATECGAVSLGIILAYYRKYVPIEELRMRCNVTRDGSSAWNISQAAQFYGLDAEAFSIDIDGLSSVSLPAIIFWEFQHFVVLEGLGNQCFYINDPACGPRITSYAEFDQAFTGVVLEFSPNAAFKRSGEPQKLSVLLKKILNPIKSTFIFLFLTQAGLIIPSLGLPVLSQIFVDQIFTYHEIIWASGLFSSLILAAILTTIFVYLQERAFIHMRAKLSLHLSSQILWHLLRLPLMFFSHRYTGELAYRMTLVNSVVESISGNLAFTFLNCLLVFIYGLAIAYYSPLLSMAAFFGAICNIILLQQISRRRQDSVARYQSTSGRSIAYGYGMLQNIDTLKSMALENLSFASWSGFYTSSLNALKEIKKKDILLGVIPPLINLFVFIALLGIGGMQVLYGKITMGMFVALQLLLANFMAPLLGFVNLSQVIQNLKVDLKRIDDILEYPLDEQFDDQLQQPNDSVGSSHKKLEGYAEFKEVTFGYSLLDPPLIDQISLKMQPGKTIGIVGTSGCGKSTLAMLLAGLVHPWKGEILFEGQLRSLVPYYQLINSIALIEQTPFLFKGSIKENLTFYNPLIKEEDIIAACRDACIHEDIMERKGGYDLQLDEGGLNLSGGQRQRLEIARGLLKNPSILILDECTSALDAEAEANVIQNIHRRGCSILMIAHRLSSIKNCDEICVMDHGKIIARGTHEQLKKSCDIYAKLVTAEKDMSR